LKASGGFGTLPRIFDTSNPGTNGLGDPDLGSPNALCNPSGPGIGVGGQPKNVNLGANCAPLGHVLIIQEANKDLTVPDDNGKAGTMEFNFAPAASFVGNIGLLDVDENISVEVLYKLTPSTLTSTTAYFTAPVLGDNSYQLLAINLPNVQQVKVIPQRSVAVTSLYFCHRH
jgi:hypothetical protein